MNFLKSYLGIAEAIAILAAALALFGYGFHLGAQDVEAAWNLDKADRARVESAAILTRIKNNEREAEHQALDNKRITEVHNAELNKVRADIARDRATGLRIGPGICAGFTAAAETKGTAGSNGSDSGGRLVREDIGRDLDALKLRVEEAFAAGRACQAFAVANEMEP